MTLNIDNVERSVVENRIIISGATLTGGFAGDTILTGHSGVAINLNYGGFTNGVGGGNNARSYVPGYSAFTMNMRSSTSQTTFDKSLLTVMPDGNTTINGTSTISNNLRVNGVVSCTGNFSCGGNLSVQDGYAINFGGTNGNDGKIYRTCPFRCVPDDELYGSAGTRRVACAR